MKVIETVSGFLVWRRSLPQPCKVGFVPTMGALHEGHESLIKESIKENDLTVLSVFVNPTQFNQTEDYEKYPKTWETDLAIAERNNVDVVFAPKNPDELYPDHYRYQLSEKELSKTLCGEFRPGHFEGMLTVVMKLLQITKPRRAYFGEKDFQQLSLIKGMADAFFLDTEIVACPTVREESGLALSSRNLRLSDDEKKIAPKLHQIMQSAQDLNDAKSALQSLGFTVEYLTELPTPFGTRRFVAAWLGKVRLIDNVKC
jgi:pantoate--beta-alanine ligase